MNFLTGLDSSIKSLAALGERLNVDHTYCFEFCAEMNKVVRSHPKTTVFLLSITDKNTFKEYSNEEIDKVAALIGATRPKDYKLKTFEAIIEAMKEMVIKDPSLEGFVIRDNNASRWKIKSPSYFFLHHVAYDHMKTPYPKDLVPLILQGEGTELFSILEINGFHAELHEIQKQWKFCEERVNQAWDQLKADWSKVINIPNPIEFNKALNNLETPFKKVIEALYTSNEKTLEELQIKWYQDPQLIVESIFSGEEQYPVNHRKSELVITHISEYKKNIVHKLNIPLEALKKKDWWKTIEDTNNGLALILPQFHEGQWIVHCHCGKKMKLFSVPEHSYQYKCCRTPDCTNCKDSMVDKSKKAGKLSEKNTATVLTYQCECGLGHLAHQVEKRITTELKRRPLRGKPVGIPCSSLCLALRHLVHAEMDILKQEFKWDGDTIYKEASIILEVNTDQSHVGVLGISQCKKLIQAFREMRGVE